MSKKQFKTSKNYRKRSKILQNNLKSSTINNNNATRQKTIEISSKFEKQLKCKKQFKMLKILKK